MTDTDHELLKRQVQAIVKGLEEPSEDELNEDGETYTAMDYVFEALDIEYIVGSDNSYRGARLLVCFGGPNVWVDTKNSVVEGYWWGSKYCEGYDDNLLIDEACEELWECTK